MPDKQITVWDPLIRFFHWSLVVAFTTAYITGEEENGLHIDSGYVVLGLVAFRIMWGFIGTTHARFSDFVRSPAETLSYLKKLISGHPPHYFGHNPAGGWMVLALLASLLVVGISGLKLYAIEEGKGPLAHKEDILLQASLLFTEEAVADEDDHYRKKPPGHEEKDEEAEEFWEEIHEATSNFTLFLIFLHIIGVIISSRLHRENLVKAMITGRKRYPVIGNQ